MNNLAQKIVLMFLACLSSLSCSNSEPENVLYFVEITSDKLQLRGNYEHEVEIDSIFAQNAIEAYKKALIRAGGVDATADILNKQAEGTHLPKIDGVLYFRLLDRNKASAFRELDILEIDSVNRELEDVLPKNVADKFLMN